MNKDLELLYRQIKDIYIKDNREFPKVERLIHMNKWNIVFTDNDQIGMAFNFTGEHNIYNEDINLKRIKTLNKFVDKDIRLLIEDLLNNPDIQSRSFLVASLNALSQSIMDDKYMVNKDFKLLENREFDFLNKEDTVTLVGYGGVVDKIRGKCKKFNVVDKRIDTLLKPLIIEKDIRYEPKDINFYKDIDEDNILDSTDILIITGSTLVNGTYQDIIKKAKHARIIGIFGPSGQILPEVLFNQGFNYITSNKIINTDKYLMDILNPMNSNIKFSDYSKSYSIIKQSF